MQKRDYEQNTLLHYKKGLDYWIWAGSIFNAD